MAKRKRVGLIFRFSEQVNAGLVNYLLSVINALNHLEDEYKPELVLFYTEQAPIDKVKSLNYQYMEYYLIPQSCYKVLPRKDWLARGVNRLSLKFLNRSLLNIEVPKNYVDVLFPCYQNLPLFRKIERQIYWIVDFNPYYFRDHYSPETLERLKQRDSDITALPVPLVLSSETVKADLEKFYPDYRNPVHVLRFACLPQHLGGGEQEPEALLNKYNISPPYFITPNQFWPHKNHKVVLEAAAHLAETQPDLNFQVLFTGKTHVSRGEGYFESLQQFVAERSLEERVKFLGLIDRNDQITLMRHAQSIIQPSLFEGWSTLVEESKALNQYLLCSDLAIHREQITENCSFFQPDDWQKLSFLMSQCLNEELKPKPSGYRKNILRFGNQLLELFEKTW